MKHMKKIIAGGMLATSMLAGCSGKDSPEACQPKWNGPVIEEPYKVIGTTAAIGELAEASVRSEYKERNRQTKNDSDEKTERVAETVSQAYLDVTHPGKYGIENLADDLSEVFCSTPNGDLKISAHGAMLIRVAINADMPEIKPLENLLEVSN